MNHEGKYMTLAEKFVSAVTSIQDADLCFNEPVDDIMLNQIESETGLTLPVEFKNLYSCTMDRVISEILCLTYLV